METGYLIRMANAAISVAFIVCYAYQLGYLFVPAVCPHRKRHPAASSCALHKRPGEASYAVLIAARNEQTVLGDLLDSLHRQQWPGALTVFVCADNCTDGTAQLARQHGARVYERTDPEKIGKGYALHYLLGQIAADYGEVFDGYFVFDADNLVAPGYIAAADQLLCGGYAACTGYRNAKNYADNWISAGYGLWFLRESEYLNRSRYLLGSSAAVSGTGFAFTHALLLRHGGWYFYLLTEDIQFTAATVLMGEKIGYCRTAVVYDEQPVTFTQSWRQRMRWVRGSLQVCRRYGAALVKGVFCPGTAVAKRWSCFDMLMATMPAFLLSMLAVVCNLFAAVQSFRTGQFDQVWLSLAQLMANSYLFCFALGLLTTLTQWRSIPAPAAKKLLYTLTFPIFMMTYIPIAAAALFCKVKWKPIVHTRRVSDTTVKPER